MKIFYDYNNFNIKNLKATSIAIGNFDGVHPGHKKIILKAVRDGKKMNIPSGIFTFKNHPKNILYKKNTIKPILSLSQKLNIFKTLGISFCVICDENKDFFHYSPQTFMSDVLINKLKIKILTVGRNFHFGENATGTIEDLKIMQKEFNFKLNLIDLLKYKNQTISSTRIRTSINSMNFKEVNQLLKRKEFISSKTIKGNHIGTELGFPTANIDYKLKEKGVYLVKVWLGKKIYYGLLNYGNAPTINQKRKSLCEIHILNIKNKLELYNKLITFQIIEKFREEKFFSSLTLLKNQIKKDIIMAKIKINNLI